MKVTVKIVNAFIDNGQGGNPAGVLLDADGLTNKQKLCIAKSVGLSETAFVSKSDTADFKLDFFTPERQIAHCGHATIAVFSYLAQKGDIAKGWYSKETIDGNRKILIENGKAFMEQKSPKYDAVEKHHSDILRAIGVTEEQLISHPQLVNTGNSFIIIGVENKKVLSQIRPYLKAIELLSEKLDLIGFYVYTDDTNNKDSDASTRMFGPRYGIDEEAGTGMAAGPLACFLRDKMNVMKSHFSIEQGHFMPSPSASKIDINLEIDNGKIVSLMAGGMASISGETEVYV